jgi:hypothetical protein
VINKTLTLGLTQPSPSSCQRGIELNLCNFVPPYTVNFISSPQGFNPTIFNPNHPGPFIGETSYNPTINEEMPLGNYIIEVTDSCGHVAQSQITLLDGIPDFQLALTTALLLESNQNNEYVIYPNPMRYELKVDLPLNTPNARLYMYNNLGQIVCDQLLISDFESINVAHLSPGIYFYELLTFNKSYTGKIIKE